MRSSARPSRCLSSSAPFWRCSRSISRASGSSRPACSPMPTRAVATIVAAMLLGADRRSAAEFSFWLAMPTMAGAFVYDLFKSRGQLTMDHAALIAFGFVVSFVCAWIVVKTFLDYVQRHGFAVFAWWRVIVGTLGLIALALGQ